MIKISKSEYQNILKYSARALPYEACGLVGGRIEGQDRIVEKVYNLTNVDHSQYHFSIDPQEQFEAIRDLRMRGMVPLGCWHSHPDTPAVPSKEDERLAYDTFASYLIMSLNEPETPVLSSYRLDERMVEKNTTHDHRQRRNEAGGSIMVREEIQFEQNVSYMSWNPYY